MITESPVFAVGVFAGALLLIAGVVFGLWLGRRAILPYSGQTLEEYHLRNLLRGLSKWTNGVADDVSASRQVVQQLSEQFSSEPEAGTAESHGSVDSVNQRFKQLAAANDELHSRIESAESALEHQSEEIAGYMSEARTDKLTGLANRRVLDDELPRRLAEWNRYQTPISVMIVDVDFFKKINDQHGHLAGDLVLQEVAQLMRDMVRESDLPIRMGGEEFAVTLPGITAEKVRIGAERIRQAIAAQTVRYEGVELKVTISCGATAAIKNDTPTTLIKRADEALYAAKRAGRNRSYWHDGRTILPIGPAGQLTASDRPGPSTVLDQDPEFGQVCLELREWLLAVVNDEAE
jgi:diguanylate cyclase